MFELAMFSFNRSDVKILELGPKSNRIWMLVIRGRIGRSKIARELTQMPGLRVIKKPVVLSFLREREFFKFKLEGVIFTVSVDPFSGDSFEISCQPPGHRSQTTKISDFLLTRLGGHKQYKNPDTARTER